MSGTNGKGEIMVRFSFGLRVSMKRRAKRTGARLAAEQERKRAQSVARVKANKVQAKVREEKRLNRLEDSLLEVWGKGARGECIE